MDYELLDSGNGRKLERFGPYTISRPAGQAVWEPQKERTLWKEADAVFTRESKGAWEIKRAIPENWTISLEGVTLSLQLTDFGHLGVFPEHSFFWPHLKQLLKGASLLNLFAYSGGATMAAALSGASVCHVDSSKGMVSWAKQNADLNGLGDAPIRWIVDDAMTFLRRELKRGNKYDAIICDPPSFGRGSKGQIFKIEEEIKELISLSQSLLSDNPLFFFLSCHTPGYSPIVMKNLLAHAPFTVDSGEMFLSGKEGIYPLPSGTYGRWLCS